MPRIIRVQVDTSPTDAGPFGILVNIQDAIEGYDTSGREAIFKLIYKAVERSCGKVIDADYEKERALFGIWNTMFMIPTEAHTDTNHRVLHAILAQIYNAIQDKVQGFNIVWEGDRQNAMVDDAQASMKRFGNATFDLNPDLFSRLKEDDNCIICGLEFEDIDRYNGRVVEQQDGEAHTWCRDITAGIVPKCPLASSVKPTPCTNLCVQAQFAEQGGDCSNVCENLVCQIGKSVRSLRKRGKIDWDGYIPKEIKYEAFREHSQKEKDKYDASTFSAAKQSADWPKVYEFLKQLSSHTVYKPSYVAAQLESCGLTVNVFPNRLGIGVIGRSLATEDPDSGTPGIWSLDLAYLLYEIYTGERFVSDYSGRGWQYRDILEHFQKIFS